LNVRREGKLGLDKQAKSIFTDSVFKTLSSRLAGIQAPVILNGLISLIHHGCGRSNFLRRNSQQLDALRFFETNYPPGQKSSDQKKITAEESRKFQVLQSLQQELSQ
jgi:hypothetical protein